MEVIVVNSMTGFGSAALSDGDTTVRVELKSVNHRFFDLTLNMPRSFSFIEDQVRRAIHAHFQRGSLSLSLIVDGHSAMAPQVKMNGAVVDQYIDLIQQIKAKARVSTWDYSSLVLLPGVFTLQEANPEAAQAAGPLILKTVEQACRQMEQMRRVEGENLRTDLLGKIDAIDKLTDRLAEEAPAVSAKYRERLHRHVEEFLGGTEEIDENRLMTEAAVFADKASIDEELTRLNSHIGQMMNLLSSGDNGRPIGRKLDFLIQEMNREINTIGSKGNSTSISRSVVALKSELEKIREQIQNIE